MSQLLSEPDSFSFFYCCASSWLVGWSWAAQYPSKKQLPPKVQITISPTWTFQEQAERKVAFFWGVENKLARIPRALIGSSHYCTDKPFANFSKRWRLRLRFFPHTYLLPNNRHTSNDDILALATPTSHLWPIVARHQIFSLSLAPPWNSCPQILASKTHP